MDFSATGPIALLIAAAAGFGLAALIGVLLHQRARDAAALRLADVASERDRLAGSLEPLRAAAAEREPLRAELRQAEARCAALAAELEGERKAQKARDEEIERKFQWLASRALEGNAEAFLKQVTERFEKHSAAAQADLAKRQTAIETLLKPVHENLGKFERQVSEMEKQREGAYAAIREQVRSLTEGQTDLAAETRKLVSALRAPKARGRWGEFQLRQVFDMAGMVEHVDFLPEHHIAGEDGGGSRRPDALVRLPGGKSIVVDAKTPLDAYLNAVEATDEAEREAALASHVRQVREHVKGLSSKEYWSALDSTPDFVVMFVPGEAFYAAAIERDHELFEFAWRNRVLIATPTNLIALVKCVAYGWQQETLAKNAQEVARQARILYERLGTFGSHLEGVGKALGRSVESYNKAVGSLERSVLPAARKFEGMGVVGAGAELPEPAQVNSEARKLVAPEFSDEPDLPAHDPALSET